MTDLTEAIEASIQNGRRLTEDAKLLHDFERYPTSYAIAILAQEEFAKSFVLTLVKQGSIPWTREVRKVLYSHESKHLVGVLIEWLNPSFERSLERSSASVKGREPEDIPSDVATAINILRHEKIEKFKSGWAARETEWTGLSRKIAEGYRDSLKQRSLYVGVSTSGSIDSFHPTLVTKEMASDEIYRAKQYHELADDASGNRVLSFREYRSVKEVIKAVFEDLAKDQA